MKLEEYDRIHDELVGLVKEERWYDINEFIEKYVSEDTNRGVMRTILMTLKHFRKDEIISKNYNLLKEKLLNKRGMD